MKIALYSPYLDTLGGGERYIATIAEILSKNHDVDLLFDKHLNSIGAQNFQKGLSQRFNLDLKNVKTTLAPIGEGSNFLSRLSFLRKYDLLFYLTDGSIFYPTAKKNVLHMQSPILGQPAKSLWGKLKLKGWNYIIYNSKFTRENSQKNWPLASKVIYPPVDTLKIRPFEKRKYILSVGRFFGYLKDKKHELLIKTFKKLQKNPKAFGWSLYLVGSASVGDLDYLGELKKLAKNLQVKFYPNLGYDELVRLYGESSIYWHASGFGENDPTKMEHFGISTVEAMAGGCVPVVIGKGGQVEIVDNGENGFLWSSLEEFEDRTLQLIGDDNLWRKMSEVSIKKASNFSKKIFEDNIKNLIQSL